MSEAGRAHRGGAGAVPGRARTTRRSSRTASCSSPGQLGLEPGATRDRRRAASGRRPSRCSRTCGAILEAAGSSLDAVVKTTVFLRNLDDFAGMNEVYARHIGETPPARSTVEVGRLPAGALVEIEADRGLSVGPDAVLNRP